MKTKKKAKTKILCIQESQNDTYHLIAYIKIEFRGPNSKWYSFTYDIMKAYFYLYKRIYKPSKRRPSALKMKQCNSTLGIDAEKWISSKSCRILHLLFIHLMLKTS